MARAMKDSGIAWIGEIPEEWEVGKAKYCVTISNGSNPNTEGDIPVYGSGASSFKTCGEYKEGPCVLVGRKGATLHIPHYIDHRYWNVDTAFDVKPKQRFSLKYYYYLASCFDYKLYISQTTLPGMTQTNYENMSLPVPEEWEQKRIVDLLDTECARIDAVIEQTRASIEEYKKLKQAVITQAVTKGIRPNRPMKDSGVDWIGRLPEEWIVIKAKYCVEISNGTDPKTEGDIPVYGSGAASFKTCGEYKEGPCVLIGRKGATLHIPHYIEGKYWNVDTAFDVKAKQGYNLKYYYYAACCFDYKLYISQTTLPGLTQTNYENMSLPCPCLDEQQEIVGYLDEKSRDLDLLIQRKEQLLNDLETYKKSKIFEYVTGKKEVL